ncbi:MAG: tRNA 2-thiouridine(34) synthase MnmA [Bacilli bacterium]|nr:tRNA 2-thiouridine(34) synthase MnmA [Bacilli bacterium]
MKKVLVGMSGGVDSSVSALLLKQDGYEVIGATMNLFNTESSSKEAKEVCDSLDIAHVDIDYSKKFKKDVMDYFVQEYSNCRTPNPCVMCNKKLKFGYLYDYAKKNNIEYIATGHYAKIEYSDEYKRYVLKKADNKAKDQSYFLYNIDKNILKYILFPLASFNTKDEIRDIARKNNLKTASKSDSQDICFIPDGNYKNFLENNSGLKENIGDIIFNGKVIGKHTGLYKYTIGQRKGLGVAHETPLYVIGFNKLKNELIVGDEKDLYTRSFKVKDYNLLLIDKLDSKMEVMVKTRYKSKEYKATISMDNDLINVVFDTPQKGVTPGQSAVFYVDDMVLGGGIIV